MRRRALAALAIVSVVASTSAQMRKTAAGHPDLQGNWTNRFATPLERPKELADTPLLSDQQVAELNRRVRAVTQDGRVMVVPSGQSLLTLLEDPSRLPVNTTYDPSFFTEFEFENRTSLITDPADGNAPPRPIRRLVCRRYRSQQRVWRRRWNRTSPRQTSWTSPQRRDWRFGPRL